MAELIELQSEDEGNLANFDTPAPEATAEESATTAPEQQATEPDIPEKYRGKSLDEIVKMHQEAEKLIGRQAQEVGEVRKLADDLIKQQLNTTKQDTQPSVVDNEIDFFEDPAKAVNHAVENNPVLKQIKEQQEQQIRQQQAAQLQERFPNFQEVVTSDDFSNWVKGSKVRLNLFTQANNNYDFDAATELLETYTAIRGMQTKQADDSMKKVDETKREKTLKSAAVQKGGTGEVSKPVYNRVDLIRLRMQDPNRYNDMQPEIMLAYQEGRIR